jgi:mono/diheme cytochrome c family protein
MKKWLLRIIIGLVMVVLLIATLVVVLVFQTERQLRVTWEIEPAAPAVPSDPQMLAEGARLYLARGCADCHGANGAGVTIIDDPMIGRFAGANLTTGINGLGATYSDVDFARSIRHGVSPEGRSLLFMPAHEYWALSDRDLGALIAHIRTLSPVDTPPDAQQPGVLAKVLSAVGQFPMLFPALLVDHAAARPAAPVIEATAVYGGYIAEGCKGCHGTTFSGGPIPGGPPSMPVPTNITPHATGLQGYTAETFTRLLREGLRADGSAVNPFMPWNNLRHMTDVEIQALWLYLQQLPAIEEGNR